MKDVHKHECPGCGFIWQHDGEKLQPTPCLQFDQAHRCPNCGRGQRFRYSGPKPAQCAYYGKGKPRPLRKAA